MNKQRKIFLGLAVGGAIVYAIYRKFGTSVVAATATPVNTTNFTGRSYYCIVGKLLLLRCRVRHLARIIKIK